MVRRESLRQKSQRALIRHSWARYCEVVPMALPGESRMAVVVDSGVPLGGIAADVASGTPTPRRSAPGWTSLAGRRGEASQQRLTHRLLGDVERARAEEAA